MDQSDRDGQSASNADARTVIEHKLGRETSSRVRGTAGAERQGNEAEGETSSRINRAVAVGTPQSVVVSDYAAPLPRIGDFVNQYEIIRVLGEGGMGIVYLARDTKLGRKVAIKFLLTTDPELTQRFILEARTTARCSHENIVVIYEVGEHGGRPYMVLEFLQGETLTEVIDWGKPMPPPRAIELMIPVVRALVKAHGEGIVHRDLKPDNIFVTDTGTIKVLDFGIAKVLLGDNAEGGTSLAEVNVEEITEGSDTNLTQRGTIMGTPQFMSPEQWGIGVSIDHRSDIWATGVMLFWMVTGRHPLAPLEGRALIETAMLHRRMPKVSEHSYGVPTHLADLIDFCLLKEKDERLSTTRVLLEALEKMQPGRYQQRTFEEDESPYAGLSAFQEGDADRFFGRDRDSSALIQRLRDQPLVGIVGPSGVGKSSLVRAGVVPTLKQSGEKWESIVIRPGRDPMASLARMLTPIVRTSTSVVQELEAQARLEERLRTEPGYLGSVLRSQARHERHKMLLFVDQFEELYTLVDDLETRQAFTACLLGVADDATAPLRVAISLRSDFLDRVPEAPEFMAQLSPGLVFVQPPNRDGLREALIEPARMAGYKYESPAIVEDMLDTLQTTPGALPLLQFAASKLWEARNTARKVMTYESYRSLGGIVGALASHADAFLTKLTVQQKTLVRTIFLRLVTLERTRAIVSVAEFRDISREVGETRTLLGQLVAARLLVVHGGEGTESMIEIVHESLIQKWPQLIKWLDETQDDAAFLDQLRGAAKQWQTRGYDQGLLWRGDALEDAKRWRKRYLQVGKGELPRLQESFLEHVLAHGARAEQRKRNIVLATITVLVGLLAVGAVALFVIVDSRGEARKQAEAAKTAEAAATSRLKQVQDKELQRLAAEKDTVAAKKEVVVANTKVEETNDELKAKNQELGAALDEARDSQERAKRAKKLAEDNEAAAKSAEVSAQRAKEAAERAKAKTEKLLEQERRRAARLREQIGSAIIDDLK